MKTFFGIILALIVVGGIVASQKQAKQEARNTMNEITNDVAKDAVEQYGIAKRQGDKMQTCVQAGFVSAAYLQAKNETEYQRWKSTEKSDCRRAGVSY